MPRTTGAPRRQVAGSARNKFWRPRVRPRSPVGRTARTSRSAQGARLAGTGHRSVPVVVVGYANDAGVVRNERGRIAIRRRPTEPRRRPRHVPTGPNTRYTPSQSIGSRTSRTSPSPNSPSAPPSDCFTRVALEARPGVDEGDNGGSTAVGAGSPDSTAQRTVGSAAAVADGTMGPWRTDPTTCRPVQRWWSQTPTRTARPQPSMPFSMTFWPAQNPNSRASAPPKRSGSCASTLRRDSCRHRRFCWSWVVADTRPHAVSGIIGR